MFFRGFMFVVSLEGIPSIDKAAKLLGSVADQMDFVISKAINNVGERARDYLANIYLGTKFTIRRNWMKPGSKFGINFKPSNKQNLEAIIFSRAPWLKLQEYGGTKGSGRFKALTIPAADIRQKSDRLIPKSLSPSKVLADMKKYRAFKIGGTIFQRIGEARGDIRPLFFLENNVHINAVLNMRAEGVKKVREWYEIEFRKALGFALLTQKGMQTG